MKKPRIISQKRVHGEVEYNDGEFAEIQTICFHHASCQGLPCAALKICITPNAHITSAMNNMPQSMSRVLR